MKKAIAFLIVTTLFLSISVLASSKDTDKWSATFIVTKGEEPALGLTKGIVVKITEEGYIGSRNTYYIEVLPYGPDTYLSEHAGGMWGTTSATFIYNGKRISVSKNDQSYPSWMRIGGCELRVQK